VPNSSPQAQTLFAFSPLPPEIATKSGAADLAGGLSGHSRDNGKRSTASAPPPIGQARRLRWGRAHTSRSSSVVKITGIALGWIGSTTAFGEVVRKP